MPLTILWFRRDLRCQYNPALEAACGTGNPLLPIYIFDPKSPDPAYPMGAAQRWWLHQSLESLTQQLSALGLRLRIFQGDPLEVIAKIAHAHPVSHLCWNQLYEPYERALDKKLAEEIPRVHLHPQRGNVLFDPAAILTKTGKPYGVFTPFWRTCLGQMKVVSASPAAAMVGRCPDTDIGNVPGETSLAALALKPKLPWAQGLSNFWTPGDGGARARLAKFVDEGLVLYQKRRDFPAAWGTSLLSPHLALGEISVHEILPHVLSRPGAGSDVFLQELGWREFSTYLLYHFPTFPTQSWNPRFQDFPWHIDQEKLVHWQKGMTGYPIVDAGMRQLWQTGWMHNRVRMIVASFLTKDLLIPWQTGAKWFWDTLVDADLGNNSNGWQWTAGCGVDAQPYFRIFNPILQGEKFDPHGLYVAQWVPELSGLPPAYIHKPWKAPASELARAKLNLGNTYPWPIVDHGQQRQKALHAYQQVKSVRQDRM